MEAPERATTAESVAKYFSTATKRSSAHYNIDVNSVVCSVLVQDVAYHAPGVNHNGIGLEHAGYARQSRAEWLDSYSRTMLEEKSAPLAAALAGIFAIPIRFVDRVGLRNNVRGITTHHEVSQAFRRSDHWDPGPNFPIDLYLTWVQNNAPKAGDEYMGRQSDVVGVCVDPLTGGTYGVTRNGSVLVKQMAGLVPAYRGDLLSVGVITESVVAIAANRSGYTMLGRDGGIFNFGTQYNGSYSGLLPEHRIGEREFVDIEYAEDGQTYICLADDLSPYHFGPV